MKAEYINHMGDDLTVVNAARVSFDKQSEWVYGVEHQCSYIELSERDTKLIKYLASHGHWTPFGHPQITIRETIPIFVARQRFKHMVGFVYNEVSRRYVDDKPEFFLPAAWRKKPETAKQGSGEAFPTDDQLGFSFVVDAFYSDSEKLYQSLLDKGICAEQARMVLPQAMYTSYYVTGSLAAWARAYKLRHDPTKAQQEIADLAKDWDAIIRPHYPASWKALTND